MIKQALCFVFAGMWFNAYSGTLSLLEYIPNRGQWNEPSLYRADLRGGKLFVEAQGATFVHLDPGDLERLHDSHGKARGEVVHAHAYRIRYLDASTPSKYEEGNRGETNYSYFLGNDPKHWVGGLKSSGSITAREIYKGIDLKYYSESAHFKCDWIVHPGAQVSRIRLRYDGIRPMLQEDGSLLLPLSVGHVIESKPVAWQMLGDERVPVACHYVVQENDVSFSFPSGYDIKRDLIIDPTLIFSSYTGSLADNWGFTATYDSSGNTVSGGNVNAIGYPVSTGAYQMLYGNGGTGGSGWACDMAICKFNSNGTALLFATYLGGSDNEEPHSMVVDGNEDIIILGVTYSADYPIDTNAYDTSYNGGGDIVVSKLSPDGTQLLGSTFVGGTGMDGVNVTPIFTLQYSLKFNYGDDARGEIISDSSNRYTVACVTQSRDFPFTTGAIQMAYGGGLQDGIIFQLNDSLTTLEWSTYFGGSDDDACYDIVEEAGGNYYIAGGTVSPNLPTTPGTYQGMLNAASVDGFVLHLNSSADTVLHCTYVGTPFADQVYFVERDRDGDVYVLGQTGGNYPVTPGKYAVPNSGQFIQKFSADLTHSHFSTTFGTGTPVPEICPTAFLVDTCLNIYAAGWGRCINWGGFFGISNTSNLPVTPDAFQSTTDGCDFYFIILNANANSLLYATHFGGAVSDEHVDGGTSRFNKSGVIYEAVCAGCGGHNDFPTQPGVVSQTNNSTNCNNAVIKFDLLLTAAQVTAQASPANAACEMDTVQFFGTISAGSSGYYWDFGDGSPTVSILNPTHVYTAAGTYRIGLYAFGTCSSDSAFLTIDVDSLVTAAFTASMDPCHPEVQYVNNSLDATSFLWDFGDGDTSALENPVHLYDSSGTYTVQLVANPGSHCADTAISFLNYTTADTSIFFIPNVFTPNGDGKNDVFQISGVADCADFHCKVYNRWGRLVFESSDSKKFWDGIVGSSEAAEGVYFYLVKLDGKEYNGHVSVLRR